MQLGGGGCDCCCGCCGCCCGCCCSEAILEYLPVVATVTVTVGVTATVSPPWPWPCLRCGGCGHLRRGCGRGRRDSCPRRSRCGGGCSCCWMQGAAEMTLGKDRRERERGGGDVRVEVGWGLRSNGDDRVMMCFLIRRQTLPSP